MGRVEGGLTLELPEPTLEASSEVTEDESSLAFGLSMFNLSSAGGTALDLQCSLCNSAIPKKMVEPALLAQVLCSFVVCSMEKGVDQYLSSTSVAMARE